MKPLTALVMSGTLLFSTAGCQWFKPHPPIVVPEPIPPSPNPIPPEPQPQPEPQPEPTPEPEPQPEPVRNDILAYVEFSNYLVGDNFNYSGTIQNASTIPVGFSNAGLELKLMKREEEMNKTAISKEFYMKLLEYGYMEFNHLDNQMKIRASNVEIDVNSKHYKIPYPLAMSQTFPMASYKFKEAGVYYLEADIDYEFEGENYKTRIKSQEFEIEELIK